MVKQIKKQKKKIETMDHTKIISSKKSKKPNQPPTNVEDPKMCFTCDVCNASFTQKHHIVRHCRIHTGEKPFLCHVCHKKFRDQSNLQNHLNIHTKEKRFQCTHCGKKFRKNDNLLVHSRTHSREKPYKCNECILSFTTNGNLTRHILIKHRLKIQEQNIKKDDRYYHKINECFVLLEDFNKHKIIHKVNKTSSSNNIKNNSENVNDYSLILKIQKKEDFKVQQINNLVNDHTIVQTEKRLYNQINECFVLLEDFNKHKIIHKVNKTSSSNIIKNNSENVNDYSLILNIKKKEDSKVQQINNLVNDNTIVQTEKRLYNQINECCVLLSNSDEHILIPKPNKASTRSNAKISSGIELDYSSISINLRKKIKKNIKKNSKVQNIKNLKNDAAVHIEKT